MIPGFSTPRLRALGSWIVGSLVAVICAALLFAWSGLYNIAASSGHLAMTRAFLEFGMRNSVRTQSAMIEAPALDDDVDRVRLGAGHYQGGCAPCHGAPGEPVNPIAEHMLPPPPTLAPHVKSWQDKHLFWIVKHGMKYTGMPAWASQNRDDEVWAVVAFLRRLPDLTPEEYRDLAYGNASAQRRPVTALLSSGSDTPDIAACAKCHGTKSAGPTSNLVPRLAGQSEPYLAQALRDYADNSRQSGIMEPIAAELDEQTVKAVAAYYAGLRRNQDPRPEPSLTGEHDAGEKIARDGVADEAIPSCLSCHGENAAERYPRLAGQPQRYLALQLRLFRSGVRANTGQARTMAAIAKRMSDRQIEQVSAYFGSLRSFSLQPDERDAALTAPEKQGANQ